MELDKMARALATTFAYHQQPGPDGAFALGEEPTSYWRDRAENVLGLLAEDAQSESAQARLTRSEQLGEAWYAYQRAVDAIADDEDDEDAPIGYADDVYADDVYKGRIPGR